MGATAGRSGDDRRGLLAPGPVPPAPEPRTAGAVAVALRELLVAGRLDLPLPGGGDTVGRWAALASFGRRDLCLARLAEGHTDAVAILAEAGRTPDPGCLYGVWASRYRGAVVRLEPAGATSWSLTGRMPFCSGAGLVDRALVVADRAGDGRPVLVAADVTGPRVVAEPGTWPAVGMDASASADVTFRGVPVSADDVVGPPGFYTGRCGFWLGGAGVAAVWLGGSAEAVDTAAAALAERMPDPDPHRLAHLATLHCRTASVDALMTTAAATVDADPGADHSLLAGTCRSAAEQAAREVLDLVPVITGPSPLTRDRGLARRLADLQVYIRQHHGGADLAALGRQLLDARLRRA